MAPMENELFCFSGDKYHQFPEETDNPELPELITYPFKYR